MARAQDGFNPELMAENMEALAANPYPGRGIVLGVSPDGAHAVQVYWVMSRSEENRNRILVEDDSRSVRTAPFDPAKVTGDPSLIIYNAMRTTDQLNTTHVVSNGDQTDTVNEALWALKGRPTITARFMDALMTRTFEPDPSATARITGAIFTPLQPEGTNMGLYDYSIIRRNPTTGGPEHIFGSGELAEIPRGAGICFHTYAGDGNPLPTFEGSPYPVPVEAGAQETAEAMWQVLNSENRVAIVAKTIDRTTGEIDNYIINQLEG